MGLSIGRLTNVNNSARFADIRTMFSTQMPHYRALLTSELFLEYLEHFVIQVLILVHLLQASDFIL